MGARFFAPVQTGPGAHPAFCIKVLGLSRGVKSGWGVMLTPHPSYCRGQERVDLRLYSPYGPYGLYRASVPVQECTLVSTFCMNHIQQNLHMSEIYRGREETVVSIIVVEQRFFHLEDVTSMSFTSRDKF